MNRHKAIYTGVTLIILALMAPLFGACVSYDPGYVSAYAVKAETLSHQQTKKVIVDQ